eukprot:251870-Pelagomonas_calceolata.AAC.1
MQRAKRAPPQACSLPKSRLQHDDQSACCNSKRACYDSSQRLCLNLERCIRCVYLLLESAGAQYPTDDSTVNLLTCQLCLDLTRCVRCVYLLLESAGVQGLTLSAASTSYRSRLKFRISHMPAASTSYLRQLYLDPIQTCVSCG